MVSCSPQNSTLSETSHYKSLITLGYYCYARMFSFLAIPIALLLLQVSSWAQPEIEIESTDSEQVQLTWAKADLDYVLEMTSSLYPSVVWQDVQNVTVVGNEMRLVVNVSGTTRLFRLRLDEIGGIGAVMISDISPSNREEMVNVTRETVVYFSEIVDPATVTTNSFYLIVNGEKIPGRVVVSSTERFATFFYDTALPASTEVRVVVNGDLIVGRNELNIDADGDGEAGGLLTADFRTLPLTRITGTGIFGFVYDSLSEAPIVGATIRVDAFAEANAVTDAEGRFQLMDMPAPEFFVHVDGSTATAAAGFMYPNVGKPFHSTPGQNVHLNHHGNEFDIYLPPMAMADIQDLSPTEDTDVGFGDAGKVTLATLFPEVSADVWERVSVSYQQRVRSMY
ncbi:MAG: hypothetical protein ACI92G_003709 [Candidatus Pelagisphaera sp.]|jgi:hypothetical protein